jgi:hypothetical protein
MKLYFQEIELGGEREQEKRMSRYRDKTAKDSGGYRVR